MANLTPHFSVSEWDRPARRGLPAAPYPREWIESRLRPLCEFLEKLRSALGDKPMRVISGFRDPEYNRLIGGARQSQHMEGRASDIVVTGAAPKTVHLAAMALHEGGNRLGGLGIYDGFVHLDVRPGVIARWTGGRTAKTTES